MTSQQKPSRANTIRQRRTSKISDKLHERTRSSSIPRMTGSKQTSRTSRQAYRPESVILPGKPRPLTPAALHKIKGGLNRQARGVHTPINARGSHVLGKTTRNSNRRGYDFAFSLGRTSVRAPMMSLPNLGSRWISAGLTLLLCLVLYTMGTANIFTVSTIEITGNDRIDADEISANLGLLGRPIYTAVPSKIVEDLQAAFPDLAEIRHVRIGLPNNLQIDVVERVPVLAWYQDGKTDWIDLDGYAFPPRGDVPGLVQIAANGLPPSRIIDTADSEEVQPFMEPAMVEAILTLFPQAPEGAPMIFDPKYGMGWQDPEGWSVYFGRNTQEIEMKKKVYQAILETFSKQGIRPTLVSVAYLDAPFYK